MGVPLKLRSSLLVALVALLPFVAGAQTQIVAFGDSLSDYGNRGTGSSGPNTNPSSQISGTWVKQLADQLGLPLNASRVGGTNYAQGSAVTRDMAVQVNAYLADVGGVANPTALYVVWGGGNDINGTARDNPFDTAGIRASATTAVANLEAQIRLLAQAGARYVLWVNMPPLHRTPAALLFPLNIGQRVLQPPSQHFNTLWAQAITRLQRDFPGLTVGGMDVYSLFMDIVSRPSAYGLTNVTGTARGKNVNPDTYLFWDEIHPTSYGHGLVADYAYELIEEAKSLQEDEVAAY